MNCPSCDKPLSINIYGCDAFSLDHHKGDVDIDAIQHLFATCAHCDVDIVLDFKLMGVREDTY